MAGQDHGSEPHRHDHRESQGGYGHAHPGGHTHSHAGPSHGQVPKDFGHAFLIGIALNLAYVIAEAFYGILAHSLALLADAGHNLGDVLGLAIAWLAMFLGRRRPGGRYTYGWRRSSILAALANAMALLVITGGIATEAVRRLAEPEPAAGLTIITVAAIGILVNGGTALLFLRGRHHDLNLRGAFLHMVADAAVTLGVVVAGALILWTGWLWLDPAISLIVSLVIVAGTWSLLRHSLDLALDAVPAGIDRDAVERFLAGLPGVREVHDLHIWGMSTTETALTAHLVRPGVAVIDDAFLQEAVYVLKHRFGIGHATLQLETGAPCELAPENVV
jgi:cobalt-zinc-cadmium efflux system protein